jgi:hypothetical protein
VISLTLWTYDPALMLAVLSDCSMSDRKPLANKLGGLISRNRRAN